MNLHDVIEKLRKTIDAREPEDWPIPLSKAELRLLLDAVELDPEHRHLLSMSHALDHHPV